MSLRQWTKMLMTRPVRTPAASRLRLETLEDRWAPDATVTGTPGVDQFRVRPGATPGTVVVSSDNSSFVPVILIPEQLTGTLFLNTGGGADTLTIESLGKRFTGDVKVSNPDGVTVNGVTLAGSLTVTAKTISVADGATVKSTVGDITFATRDTADASFPLNTPLLRDRQATAGITIGAATLTGRDVSLTSSVSTTKLASTDVSQDTRAVALADVNGDGRLDLITAATDTGTGGGLGGPLLLFLNTGNPLDPFSGSVPQTITRGGGMTSLAVGDVTGDGRPDLVVGSTVNPDLLGTARYSRLYVNTGNSGVPFQETSASAFNVGTGSDYTTSVALADVNADGKLDLVFGNGSVQSAAGGFVFSATRLFLNQGGSNPFSGSGTTVGFTTDNTQAVAFADLNGDGKTDLITANAPTTLLGVQYNTPSQVFLNQGGATPFAGTGVAFGGDGTLPVTSVAVGDLNGDGQTDIVLGVNGKPSQVFLSSATKHAYEAVPVAPLLVCLE